jgi:hypothetical protein
MCLKLEKIRIFNAVDQVKKTVEKVAIRDQQDKNEIFTGFPQIKISKLLFSIKLATDCCFDV